MSVIHISGAEAARDVPGLLAQVRAGAEIVIDDGLEPPIVMRLFDESRGRTIAESLKLARAHAGDRGYDVVMDADFSADLEERIRDRKPRDTSAWD